ncbi:MAG: gliding motility-associated C-terminal domain-containing protein [Bacteroidetes bacterium]|nr:gliding motility-associated C-terminal domain-containing protein [Bacteroidota bacterium]
MKKHLNILFLFILISLGWSSYAQKSTLPVACGGSFATYGVYGDNGNSFFEWEVTGGDIIRNYNDSIVVQWNNVGGPHFLTVTETNIYGCVGEPYQDTVIITIPFVDLGLDGEVCEGESYEFIASADDVTSYLWQDDSDGETFIATESGDYWVKVTDEYGCVAADTAALIVHELPDVDLGPDTTLCGEEGLFFDVSEYGVSYDWFNGDIAPTFTAYTQTRDQEIWVDVTDEYGCVGSDTVVVRFCGELEIPSAFTPNDGDNINPTWAIEALFAFPDATVDIYNRWGDRVFHSTGYSSDQYWDGKDQKGKKLPMDSYYYVIDLKNGEDPIVGTVTIIR